MAVAAQEAIDLVYHLFAELGVVVLLFFVGLETRIADILKIGGRAVTVALARCGGAFRARRRTDGSASWPSADRVDFCWRGDGRQQCRHYRARAARPIAAAT